MRADYLLIEEINGTIQQLSVVPIDKNNSKKTFLYVIVNPCCQNFIQLYGRQNKKKKGCQEQQNYSTDSGRSFLKFTTLKRMFVKMTD